MLINGVRYHVEARGAGKPLVLVHGFSGSGANWAAHAVALADYFRVILVDLPGHGETEPPDDIARYTMERTAQDVVGVLDALGIEKAYLLGYSMGGRLALYTALAYHDRFERLILESASPGLKTEAERSARVGQDEALARRIENEGIPAFASAWTNLPLFASQPQRVRETLHAERLKNNAVGLANSLRGMGTGVQPSLWGKLSELRLPTLLLCGELDAKFRGINTEMQELMPDAELVIVAEAGHTVHAEQPERFRAEVLRFLGGSDHGALQSLEY